MLDLKDVFLFLGIGIVAFGLWQIYPPAAYIVGGGVIVILTTWGRFK